MAILDSNNLLVEKLNPISKREPHPASIGTRSDNDVGSGEKFAHFQSSVRGPFVVMEHSVTITTQLRLFVLNVLPRMPHNVIVELCASSLTLGGRIHHAQSL